jgi:MFS family permease
MSNSGAATPIPLGDLMNQRQWLAVAVCVLLNVIDGFDILVMSTAAPAVGTDLRLSTSGLGLVLSASLWGMMLGALLISPVADRIGRRPVILFCLALEFTGMLLAGFSQDLAQLLLLRLTTGLGVGAIMPVLNTAVAELSSAKQRNLAITAQAIGYPLGGLLAAIVGGVFLDSHDWRVLLQITCIPTLSAFVLVPFYLPESVDFLVARRPPNALARVNKVLRILGKTPITILPGIIAVGRDGAGALLKRSIFPALVLFALATFVTQFSFYFFLSWLPTVLAPHLVAFDVKSAGSIMLNLGGIGGDLLFAAFCFRIAARGLTLGALMIAFASIVALGYQLSNPILTAILPLVAGAALFAAMAGIYATAPRVFPPLLRAAGTGIAFSLGRFGGALAPLVGGIILGRAGLDIGTALLLLASPLVIAAILLSTLTDKRLVWRESKSADIACRRNSPETDARAEPF